MKNKNHFIETKNFRHVHSQIVVGTIIVTAVHTVVINNCFLNR